MSLETYVGPEGNLLEMKPEQCHRILLAFPPDFHRGNECYEASQKPRTTVGFSSHHRYHFFRRKKDWPGYQLALERVCSEAAQAIDDGIKVIILSDRGISSSRIPLSALIACGGVHHHPHFAQEASESCFDG